MRLKHHQRGISLVELMVGMVVALLVLASAFVVYMTGSRASTDSVRANRFNQDVREIVNIMAADIRRAGYTANVDPGSTNAFTLDANNLRISGGNCILYSYDASFLQVGGAANPKNVANAGVDFFGFRRNGGTLQMLNPAANVGSTAAAVCAADDNWLNLTDPSQMTITALSFDTVGSRCLAYIKTAFKPDDNTTYEEWTVAAGNDNACTAAAKGSALPDVTTHHFVETRQIQLTLAASHPSDATINRAIGGNTAVRETILIRNNRILAP